jgi:predicted Zn-dependent protease
VITLQAAELLQSDDEVAAILSHEMGHAFDPEPDPQQAEPRADALSIGFLIKAGFDARSAGRGLQMMGRERGQGAIGNLFWTIALHLNQVATQDSHGSTLDRITRMKEVFAKGCAAMNNRPIGCKEGWR